MSALKLGVRALGSLKLAALPAGMLMKLQDQV